MRWFAPVLSVPFVAIAFGAQAADLPFKAPPPAVVVYNWTGFYIGGNIGGKWGDLDTPIGIAATASTVASTLGFSSSDSSFIGGGQLGFNWQFNQWVFGIEADLDAQSLGQRTTIAVNGQPFLFRAGDSFTARNDWQGSVRGRVGYAWGPWLAYVTGGVAFTEVKVGTAFGASPNGVFPASSFNDSQTLVGGTIGGGLEYGITRNLSVGVEGRYTDYGRTTANLGTLAVFNTGTVAAPALVFGNVTSRVDLSTWEVTGRVNWRF